MGGDDAFSLSFFSPKPPFPFPSADLSDGQRRRSEKSPPSSQWSWERSLPPPLHPQPQSKTHINFPEHFSSALRVALFHVMMKIYLGCVGGGGAGGVGGGAKGKK